MKTTTMAGAERITAIEYFVDDKYDAIEDCKLVIESKYGFLEIEFGPTDVVIGFSLYTVLGNYCTYDHDGMPLIYLTKEKEEAFDKLLKDIIGDSDYVYKK